MITPRKNSYYDYLMANMIIKISKKDKIIISHGDNDSLVKIAEYKLQDLLNTMVSV